MFWGCIVADGRRELIPITTNINREIYCNILENYYIGKFIDLNLLQDNAKPQTSKHRIQFFTNHGINVLPKYPP